MKQTKLTAFELAIQDSIIKTIKQLRRDGVTGMSVNNLRMVVRPPQPCAGAPSGTNAAYYYASMFDDVVAITPIAYRFTLR